MFDLQGARVESLLREVRPQCLAAVTDKTVNLSLPSPALDPASDAARLARNILIALHSTARYLVDATVWAKAPRAELPASVAPKALQQRAGRPITMTRSRSPTSTSSHCRDPVQSRSPSATALFKRAPASARLQSPASATSITQNTPSTWRLLAEECIGEGPSH